MTSVAIVGGGPVGLYLALALLHEGIEPRVYERRSTPHAGSRSIGIHPPSMDLFDELGLGDAFLAEACAVERGFALGERGVIGDVSFRECPGPHRFVATLEQHRTERILRDAVVRRAPDVLVRGVEVVEVAMRGEGARLTLRSEQGEIRERRCSVVVGADGKHGLVRRAAGIDVESALYDGAYVMADAPDATELGRSAAVLMTERGLVESFPLPRGRRRWVVRRDTNAPERATPEEIVQLVRRRTRGHVRPLVLDADRFETPSVFRAERRLARVLAKGHAVLVGDAAHVVSPIGGQGMNLGWLGARSVARVLARELGLRRDPTAALQADAARRRHVARVVARRAEMNMWLGRPTPHVILREALVAFLLALPTHGLLARAFTMRGLELGI